MDRIKKLKVKKQDGTFSDYIPIGADAENIDTTDGESVQLKLNKKPYYYNSVADMKADNKLKIGDMAITLGYYEANDGGGAEYKIKTSSENYYEELNNGLIAELIIKDVTVNQFGAKHNGTDNDSIYIQNMLNELGYCILDNYTYLLKSPILLKTDNTLFGISSKATIKIDNSIGNISAIKLTKNNNVYNFTIIQNFSNWQGNIFECSSATLLEDTGFTKYENLRIQIHDLTLLTSSGTFYHLWAAHEGEDGTQYTVWGLWNSKVWNIECKGIINYIQRVYTYNPSTLTTERAWITDNMFRDCTFDSVTYGWFGNKTEITFEDEQYSTPVIKIYNCTVQAGSWSKNYVFMTGNGSVTIKDSIPYDWGVENPSYPAIKIKNTKLTGSLSICCNSFDETWLSWIGLTESTAETKDTYLSTFLEVNGVKYFTYEHAIPLRMENTNPENWWVYQIGTRISGKVWSAFDLYYSFNCPVSRIQLYMDSTWGDKVYYTGLNTGNIMAGTKIKFLKKDNNFYIAFKNGGFYSYLKTVMVPAWLKQYFNELHLTKIGNNVDITDYTELALTNLNPKTTT